MADFINVFISDIVLVFKKNNKNKLIFLGILLLSIIFAMVKLFAFGVTEEEYSSLLLIRFIKNEVSFWFFLILNLNDSRYNLTTLNHRLFKSNF